MATNVSHIFMWLSTPHSHPQLLPEPRTSNMYIVACIMTSVFHFFIPFLAPRSINLSFVQWLTSSISYHLAFQGLALGSEVYLG